MPLQSSQTFSDRRGINEPMQMNRSEQTVNTPLRSEPPKEGKGGGDSAVKVLIWVVVVVLVAVVIYLLINNLTGVKTPEQDEQTGSPETQVQTLEPIVADKNPTSGAESAPDAADYLTTAQTVGSSSSDTFTIDSFSTESYVDFFRIVFMVTSSGTAKFPLTEAALENQKIDITFNSISEDKSGLPVSIEQSVLNSVVTSIMHNSSSEEGTESYTVELSAETGYFMHLLEEPNRIVIDVREEIAEEETGEETEEETEQPTETETGKPTVKTLTNEFSKNPQWIVSDVTGNVVNTTGYRWQDYGAYVRVTYDLSGGIPNVNAQIQKDGSVSLVVVMENRVSKNATSTININHGNVTTMDAVTAGNTSTLTLHLNKESDYRIYATESPMQFFIEVKN